MRKFTDVVQSRTGSALAGATVTVRVANPSPGTGALASIYSDDGLSLIAGSAVSTDVNGRYSFYAADGRYDMTVTGTNITTLTLADTGEGGEVLYAKTLNNIQFADQFSSLQAAIDNANTVGGGIVILPPGTTVQNTAINLYSNVSLIGMGRNASVVSTSLSSGVLFDVANMTGVRLGGFKILKAGSTGGTAIRLNYGQYCHISDLEINGNFATGINLTSNAAGSTLYNEFKDILIFGLAASGTAVNILPAGGRVVNGNRFLNIVTGPNSNGNVIGFNDQGGHENVIIGGDYSTGDTTGTTIGIQASAATRGLTILGATIESNNIGLKVIAGAEGVRYTGCTIDSNSTQVSDAGNRSWAQSNVQGISPNFSVDTSGNLKVNGLSFGGASALNSTVNAPAGWTLATSGTNIAQLNAASLDVLAGKTLSIGGGTALATTNQTGTGSLVLATSPVLVTPALGVAAATSLAVGGGTTLTGAVVYSQTITPASVAAATAAEQTFTVTGLASTDKVIVNPAATGNSTAVGSARVSAGNTIAIQFINPTAGALTPGSGTYNILAIRS